MQTMQSWVSSSLKQMLPSLSKNNSFNKLKETEDMVNEIFTNYYEDKIFLENGNTYRSNKNVRMILAVAYKKAKEKKNKLIFSITAQLLMRRQPGLLIDYKSILNNYTYENKNKGLSIWIDNYILHEDNACQ